MKNIVIALLLAIAIAVSACQPSSKVTVAADATGSAMNSGIDVDGMDTTVRPQDDFFLHANGAWIANTEIPADQSSKTSFSMLHNKSLGELQEIIQEVAKDAGSDESATKIGEFYNAFLDQERVNSLGVSPLEPLFKRINALQNHDQVAAFFGESNELGMDAPFNLFIDQDEKDPKSYIVILWQTGLGMPDRDYYFDESERGVDLRNRYRQFVATLLELSGIANSQIAAESIMALETSLADHHWDKVRNRDANQRYNKFSAAELRRMFSNLDIEAYFNGLGAGMQDNVIVSQPSYLKAVNDLFPQIPLETWKMYLRYQALASFANYLSQDFVDAGFEFFSKTLQGREQQLPRWKRAINSINANLGELLGQLYVEKHFPPEAKTRMVELVNNLILAYEESIRNLDWMSEETKAMALDKLSKFTPKIGYPDIWKEYSGLTVAADDLVGNIQRAREFAHYREIDKLGSPVDRKEWFMSPQQVNAYYNPPMNEIVFPAAILQPPFFVLDAEDARNYGAIGMVIGHEIGHGFDDQGSKYDGDGALANWWTDADRSKFEERADRLIKQYGGFEALPGLFVNGELTLGENIGDLGGTSIALRAYELSLNGNESPIIDGLTGRERFFLGMAQAWRSLYRPEALETRVKSDPHSPPVFRVNGVMPNIDEFYETFSVGEGDAMYLPPEERVRIWR